VPDEEGPGLTAWWHVGLVVVGAATHLLFRLRVANTERIPLGGPAILAANHVSGLDGVFLAYLAARFARRPTRYLVAAEFFQRPMYGFWLRTFQQIPIHRGGADSVALEEAAATVSSGALAGIFPEGTVNERPNGQLLRGRTGVARIALTTGAPVIPVGIWGTQQRWPAPGLSFRRPLRPRVAMSVGDRIQPMGDPDSTHDLRTFTRLVMEGIAAQVIRARAGAPGRRVR
jgi:1-acyl-sn-glycerol-3-phosphate acyltransferase